MLAPRLPMWVRIVLAVTIMVSMSAPAALAQQAAADAEPDGAEALRVFLDCGDACDFDHLRTDIPFVNYVRDRRDAQVHVLVTTEETGGGGTAFTLDFVELEEFSDLDDQLVYFSSQNDTKALFMTVWRPSTRSAEHSCGIRQG